MEKESVKTKTSYFPKPYAVKGGRSMPKKKKRLFRKSSFREAVTGYFFLLPALILLGVFLLYPMASAFYYSFTDFYILTPDEKSFIGLENFTFIFQDAEFRQAFWNTVYFTIIVVPVQLAVALGLALLINQKLKFRIFFRTAFFSPVVMSLVVVSILWTFMYNPNEGLINEFLGMVGIPSQPFLTSPDQAMNSIIVMSVWQGAGFQMMIFLAGLQNIPNHLYEAADIDGANRWHKFWNITLPGLRNVALFIFITITIAAFKLLVQPMIMTQGGPLGSTKSLVYHIYETGFNYRDVGYASAMAVIFTVIVLIITIVQRILIREERG
ncbi:carbohydrate ABC transporter permease [Alteribacillus bidgolensis]|uniref:Carbohydrate ABC transporter membrane protein 1, CUT1 family n=1 Tax=Alteribacillus bidgolensis TaxID=930129 RepID=A0A1G8MI01_9BACI|nr:sugar ABC transporter permease [Alteribacillus bidgolensis]SDI67477.1 carbohydrate ABC transporter membrane protein 1, CUT1 family [Alteribacillus bidgolensis]